MKILIVGGGVGGLTLGAFLRGSSHEHDIVEKCPDWSHQGFLVSIWDNGRDILEKLGLAEAFDAMGSRAKYYSVYDGKGRELRTNTFTDLYAEFGGAATIVDRGELHSLLLSKNDASKICMKTAVEKITQTESGVTVTFTSGETGTYDLVVGADGVHSTVRAAMFGKDGERYTNWRAWFGWIPEDFGRDATITEYVEPGELVAIFRTKGKSAATFFAPAEHGTFDAPEGRIERLKQIFKDESAVVPAFEKLGDNAFMPSDLLDVDLPHWTKGRMALLGDAAHCFGPITGMGCSMAMEDGYVLAAHLLRVSATETLPEALLKYEKSRKKRVGIVKNMTSTGRPILMAKSRFVRKALDLIFGHLPHMRSGHNLRKLLAEEI